MGYFNNDISSLRGKETFGLAIGYYPNSITTTAHPFNIGFNAGAKGGSDFIMAIGNHAGAGSDRNGGICIGNYACYNTSNNTANTCGIAIGDNAAYYGQQAPNRNSGCIALGSYAGITGTIAQPSGQICINALGIPIGSPTGNACFIAPIRSMAGKGGAVPPDNFYRLIINAGTREIVYYS
jgi:hypothetical protein